MKTFISRLVVLAMAAATLILLATTPASAFKEVDTKMFKEVDQREFGMVGVTRGQTARINIVSIDNPDFRKSGPMRVELMFLDSRGNVFLNSDRTEARKKVTLAPGQADFLDFSVDSLRDEIRTQVRAKVRGVDNPDYIVTLEVFDSESGRTFFVLDGQTPPDIGDKQGPEPHM